MYSKPFCCNFCTVLPRSKVHVLECEKAIFCFKSRHESCSFSSACACNRVISFFFLNSCNSLLYALAVDQRSFWWLKLICWVLLDKRLCLYSKVCLYSDSSTCAFERGGTVAENDPSSVFECCHCDMTIVSIWVLSLRYDAFVNHHLSSICMLGWGTLRFHAVIFWFASLCLVGLNKVIREMRSTSLCQGQYTSDDLDVLEKALDLWERSFQPSSLSLQVPVICCFQCSQSVCCVVRSLSNLSLINGVTHSPYLPV